jgi:hypothetical protein
MSGVNARGCTALSPAPTATAAGTDPTGSPTCNDADKSAVKPCCVPLLPPPSLALPLALPLPLPLPTGVGNPEVGADCLEQLAALPALNTVASCCAPLTATFKTVHDAHSRKI